MASSPVTTGAPSRAPLPRCRHHGKPTKRQDCRECNAIYMREYLKRRRYERPGWALWERARKRASDQGLAFALDKHLIAVPQTCPALGISIELLGKRAACSPSLDRIVPERGYIPTNVRVISDRANRLKSNHSLSELRRLSEYGPVELREEYGRMVAYVEREQLLSEVRAKAAVGGRAGEEWAKIANFLDRIFRRSLLKDSHPVSDTEQ